MQRQDQYLILKKIDSEKRYVGLTLDELIPIGGVLAVCFYIGHLITGFCLAGGLFIWIRHYKKGQGTGWLIRQLIWSLPDGVFRNVFVSFIKHTPPTYVRHWRR